MLLFVYEYLTGGGLWSEPVADVRHHPLLDEGRCMLRAICDDFARVAGVELVRFRDARLNDCGPVVGREIEIRGRCEELDQLALWSGRADGTLLIAPEQDQRLLLRCELVQRSGGRLVSPDPAFVELTTNKHATASLLSAAGVPTPEALLIDSLTPVPPDFLLPDRPLVLKPVDGVGSLDTYLLKSLSDWPALAGRLSAGRARQWRLERFCSGRPVSVSALCGPRTIVLLPPCAQRLSQDGCFTYLGGHYPLESELTLRAGRLARRTFAALPSTTGYVGVDMILSDETGSEPDVVLDVNPRLTTSYVGLRHAASSNLAEAMLAVGRGRSRPLFFQAGHVEFDCQGRIRGSQPREMAGGDACGTR